MQEDSLRQSDAESEDLRKLEAEVAAEQKEICALEQDIQNDLSQEMEVSSVSLCESDWVIVIIC